MRIKTHIVCGQLAVDHCLENLGPPERFVAEDKNMRDAPDEDEKEELIRMFLMRPSGQVPGFLC
jgi:hypothetical protein